MDILVNIGHDDAFANDLEKMGFLAACVDINLTECFGSADAQLIAIIRDPYSTHAEILSFTIGEGASRMALPAYITFLHQLDRTI